MQFFPDQTNEISEMFENGDQETKSRLIKQYGRRMIKQITEIRHTEKWLEEYSKKCPGCKANIQVS